MPNQKLQVTKADLALIDGAIAMIRADQMKPNAAMIGVDPSVACDPVDVAALVVYKAYNSCLTMAENEQVLRAKRLSLAPNVSLPNLIASRNKLAAALKEPEIRG